MSHFCFRCGHEDEGLKDRQCPSCLEDGSMYTCLEMSDLLNSLYLSGKFDPDNMEIEEDV